MHVCIKFCLKLSLSAVKALGVLCLAFDDEGLNWTTVFEWHSRLKAGSHSFEDDKRSE